jgi:uncharacterized membrane protein YeaQ/YmgE (transglycosylase-associated protein family)
MNLDMQSILTIIIVGGIAGWLAGLIVRGYGLGLVGNVVVGVVGGFLSHWLLPMVTTFTIGDNRIVNEVIYCLIGAVILLLLVGLVRKAR